ncbi:hypothetical protein GCM10008171_01860 [Methylopila jiangsuensis]|uniref:Uncharacterized protein n=1 Tax=Methylopila jiangsuensis TaxID=586230 RepID=A0A9W6JG52_9HYPH|nr:hypothetical protein [Methylopila jiangsuensis]MDR6287352.1 hypothetical protein [Methylopila jiangsuensis]GLK74933.1 hypothetical protein GCM10008171_01860 [Methylopila jiangsuensis]
MTATTVPVACTLAPGAFGERVDLIGDLNREALRTRIRIGPRLELGYDPAAEGRVRVMVERERQCCGFLDFEVRLDGGLVILAITAPDDGMADAVLSPFESGADGAKLTTGTKLAVSAAATSATAAVACGACCVLPLALPAVAVGMFGGALSWFAGARPWMVAIAALLVVAAWGWIAIESRRTSRRPARSSLALAVAWPLVEGPTVSVIKG